MPPMSASPTASALPLIAAIVAAVRTGDDQRVAHLVAAFAKAADAPAAFALRRALIGDLDARGAEYGHPAGSHGPGVGLPPAPGLGAPGRPTP